MYDDMCIRSIFCRFCFIFDKKCRFFQILSTFGIVYISFKIILYNIPKKNYLYLHCYRDNSDPISLHNYGLAAILASLQGKHTNHSFSGLFTHSLHSRCTTV